MSLYDVLASLPWSARKLNDSRDPVMFAGLK